jgi:hypothetical protein
MQFSEILAGVYAITTDLDLDLWRRSLTELEQCQNTMSDDHYTQPDLGTRSIRSQGAACVEVLQYFQSDNWLDAVTKLCVSNDEWITNWASPSVSWFRRHTRFTHVWHMAPANYVNHEWHVDCLRTVVHGMMYLDDKDDSTATTLFRDGSNEIPVTTGFNRGWILLQNGKQMHRGINTSDRSRYTFKWMLTLDI